MSANQGPSSSSPRRRNLGAWGFEGESFPPSPQLLDLLHGQLGETPHALPRRSDAIVPAPAALPTFPAATSTEGADRLACSRGQGITDLIRLRTGTVPAYPDAVVRPSNEAEVETTLAACSAAGVRVIPRGGGTSVTGGVNVIPGDSPIVVLDLSALDGLLTLDDRSALATFWAGTPGPSVEAALGARGYTLGHFPQSWELSTVGGWAAARASGQESFRYGSMSDLVAGLELVAPAGRLSIPALPNSAAGPDLRQLVIGSEGRLGVITRATVRVRPKPARMVVDAALMPSWEQGAEACRALAQEEVPLALLRLSDSPETDVAMAVGLAHFGAISGLIRRFWKIRGIGSQGCLMLMGAVGDESTVRKTLARARGVGARFGRVGLGTGAGEHWRRDRFRHPYLRDSLMDVGVTTDTFETAVPWSKVQGLYDAVRAALYGALESETEKCVVMCHLSHPYIDGTSMYFTFFFRSAKDVETTVARWAALKRAATTALVGAGGALSHHHGVGNWHAPWLEKETGADGLKLVAAAARTFDPQGLLNPHVLLDPVDRLTV